MRGAQPALSHRRMRIDGALEHHLLEVAGEHAQHDEDVGVRRRGRDEQFQRRRSGDLGLLRERRAQEGDAVAHRVECHHGFLHAAFVAELAVDRIEIKPRPLGAIDRPFALHAFDETVDVTHLKLDRRLLVPAVLLAVQEIIEEAQLQIAAVVRVEMRPVLDAVHLEPFALRGCAHEAFEIAARMQRLAAPIRRREKRHLDLRPHRRACAVIGVVERMSDDVAAEIAAVFCELVV